MRHAEFSFDPDLVNLLPKRKRRSPLPYFFTGPQSVKHLIEALGIPHTEVGSVIVGGVLSGLGYLVRDGDRLEIHGVETLDPLQSEPSFVLDGHLGRLAAGLRMLGLDCLYERQIHDDELYNQAIRGSRYLLTRDRHLLMRKGLGRGCLVRSLEPRVQLHEVAHRFELWRWAVPLRRCIRCNDILLSVEKRTILDRLEPLTRMHFNEFRQCPSCFQLYWRGSHYDRMQSTIAHILAQRTD